MSVFVEYNNEGLFKMDESLLASVKQVEYLVPKLKKHFIQKPLYPLRKNKIVDSPHRIVVGFKL